GTWYTYAHDLTKNVTELYKTDGTLEAAYDYTPYGSVTQHGINNQPFQWSSEVYDSELGLVYYNYRHYNPMDGRWINRDPIAEQGGQNLYEFIKNRCNFSIDILGKNRYITEHFPQPDKRIIEEIEREIFNSPEEGMARLLGEYIRRINLHIGVAVDTWESRGNKYIKTGVTTFNYQAKLADETTQRLIDGMQNSEGLYGNIGYGAALIWLIFSRVISMVVGMSYGELEISNGMKLKGAKTIQSNPCQDIKMLELINNDVVSPDSYNILFSNCITWSNKAIEYGIHE
ncbi:MAG: RHS repeat-associated core domain-containing protein, partial [Akkermansia sp.]